MLKPGDTFERYVVEEPIGQGGMGTVYRAHDPRLERRVALKVISDAATSPEASERLLREARAVAALDHPNAVSIFDVGTIEGAPYIVMELVTGRTLRPAIADTSVGVTTKLAWLGDVARALGAAHKRGIVHRDVKPENVMVREDGVVKVLDFGIARRTGSALDPQGPTALPTLTREGVKVGTPVYMAPEQIRGKTLDGRTDEFAWAVVAYELLTGRLPWQHAGDSLSLVASILTDEVDGAPLDVAGAPAGVKTVLLRCLAKKPDDRFASMDEVARALEAAAKGEPIPSSGQRVAESSKPPSVRAAPPAPTSPTLAQKYSTQEVQEILSRAIEQQEMKRADTRLGFEDLVAAAREVGVDPEVLRQASRELRERGEVPPSPSEEDAEMQAWIRRKRRSFHRHLGIWLVVQVVFFFLALSKGDTHAMMPGLFWAIGLGIHGITAYTASPDDWEDIQRKLRRRARWRKRRNEVVGKAIDEGAALLLQTGAAIRQHLEAPPAAPPAKVRIASTGGLAEAQAEAEAEAALHEEKAQERRR